MSLLIKALAIAAKDHKLQQAKRQAAELTATLGLVPAMPAAGKAGLSTVQTVSEHTLSLAAESGFSAAVISSMPKLQPDEQTQAAKIKVPFVSADPAQSLPLIMQLEPDAVRTADAASADQVAATKAFVKHMPAATTKTTLVWFGVAGSLLLAIVFQGYVYIRDLSELGSVQLRPMTALAVNVAASSKALVAMPEITNAHAPASEALAVTANNLAGANAAAGLTRSNFDNEYKLSRGDATPAGTKKSSLKIINHIAHDTDVASAETIDMARLHSSLQVSTKKPLTGVDPALLAAYQAFNRGDNVAAQQQYRQLLQHDARNVDALLGMAAIAQRQGRDADAVGWYQALLQVEPRNMNAQAALLSLQPPADAVTTGSRIKSMLVQQPEAASLHEALGNVYAAQNQWTAAQEAYFNASRFAPDNADYALNLAISLDQLGKYQLALEQYQRSLDLINSSGASSPDRAQLEARVHELQ